MKARVLGTVLLAVVLAILYLATTESETSVQPAHSIEEPAIQPLKIN